MREILFRGKRSDNGEWVEGNLFIPDEIKHRKAPTEILIGTNVVRISYEVDPDTVGQYTGLKDKNGKRIFEGDIIKSIYNDMTYVVRFGECMHLTEYKEHECGFYCDGGKWCVEAIGNNVSEWEIKLGNIHDNPELLVGNNG